MTFYIEGRNPENDRPTDYTSWPADAWMGIDYSLGKDWTAHPWPPESPDEVQP